MLKKIIILACIPLIIIGIVFGVLHSSAQQETLPGINLVSSAPIAQNIQFPFLKDKNTLRFFTGSSFAELNLTTFKSSLISPEFNLSRSSGVEWGDNFAVIKFDSLSANDELYSLAPSQLRDSPSWWAIDFKSGSVTLLVSSDSAMNIVGVSLVQNSQNEVYTLLQKLGSNNQSVVKQTFDGKSESEKKQITNASLIGTTTSGALLQTPKEMYLFSNKGLKKLNVQSNRKPLINNDSSVFVYESIPKDSTTNVSSRGDLFSYNVASRKTQLLAKSTVNTGYYFVLSDGIMVLPLLNSQSTPQAVGGNSTGGIASWNPWSKRPVNLVPQDNLQAGTIQNAWILDNSGESFTILATNTSNEAVFLGTDTTISQKKSPYPLIVFKKSPFTFGTATLNYDSVQNSLKITDTNIQNQKASRQRLDQKLSSMGIDPNQVSKSWYYLVLD